MREEGRCGWRLRDEVDLIMKRLRIPRRGRVGGQVNNSEGGKGEEGGAAERDGSEGRHRERSAERLNVCGV